MGYVAIAILVIANLFFYFAILKYKNSGLQLRLTVYGFVFLILDGLLVSFIASSRDLLISIFIFLLLAIIFRWFYRGIERDNKKETKSS